MLAPLSKGPGMGFENRKSIRVKLDAKLYFWLGTRTDGPGLWGHAKNISATGLAFDCDDRADKGDEVVLELRLPKQPEAMLVRGKVVHCERVGSDYQWRVNFGKLEEEPRHQIRLYVLELAEPGSGWAHAYFPGKPAMDLKYKEMPAGEKEQWLQRRAYLSMKELLYVKNFQALLQHALGEQYQEGLKIVGTRALKDGSDVWLELDLPLGQLHFLAKTLWCRQEAGSKPESGLQLTAFHKDEGMKLEKEF